MIDIKNKKDCCGCYGCENICPKNCIKMIDDNEGFWYPKVDSDKCIDCGLCDKVCPVKHSARKEDRDIEYFACKSLNNSSREKSSSGGVFNILYNYVIENNGAVFGVSFDDDLNVRHSVAETMKECEQFRGSKYVQSRLSNTYNEVKDKLNINQIVLFSGTQCQVNGLNLFLRKKYDNLITVEIICHGVPSPKVHKKYLDIKSKEYNSEVKSVNFRDKRIGWKKFSYTLEFKSGQVYSKDLSQDIYMQGFLKDLYLRPSCYECTSKNYKSNADISLADYWGIQNIHPEIDDDKGTSLVLVNTEKGKKVFQIIKDKMDIIKTDGEFAVNNNPCIVRPVKYNKKREQFFDNIDKIDLIENITKNTKVSFIKKVKGKIKSILIRIKRLIKG